VESDTQEVRAVVVRSKPSRDRLIDRPIAEHADEEDPSLALGDESEDEPSGDAGDIQDVAADEVGQQDDEERERVRQAVEDVVHIPRIVESAPSGSGSSRAASASTGPRQFRDEIIASSTGSMTIPFSLPALQAQAAKRRRLLSQLHDGTRSRERTTKADLHTRLAQAGVSADAGIANRDLSSAEAALSRTVTKDDFKRMVVVGQFNKGFVIARSRSETELDGMDSESGMASGRGNDDLYIVDQHASDEKYNFETLQRGTRIKAQRLIKCVPVNHCLARV
jgi:DNA mismatch repair protein PMS2